MVVKKDSLGRFWTILREDIDVRGVKDPSLAHVSLGCSQREADIDHGAVQSKADLFRRSKTN